MAVIYRKHGMKGLYTESFSWSSSILDSIINSFISRVKDRTVDALMAKDKRLRALRHDLGDDYNQIQKRVRKLANENPDLLSDLYNTLESNKNKSIFDTVYKRK